MNNKSSDKEERARSVIPKGIYCYSGPRGANPCPYWSLLDEYNGYCAYLGVSDEECDGLSLLWDQCKECGINKEEETE
jgi:hypothetical protein